MGPSLTQKALKETILATGSLRLPVGGESKEITFETSDDTSFTFEFIAKNNPGVDSEVNTSLVGENGLRVRITLLNITTKGGVLDLEVARSDTTKIFLDLVSKEGLENGELPLRYRIIEREQ